MSLHASLFEYYCPRRKWRTPLGSQNEQAGGTGRGRAKDKDKDLPGHGVADGGSVQAARHDRKRSDRSTVPHVRVARGSVPADQSRGQTNSGKPAKC